MQLKIVIPERFTQGEPFVTTALEDLGATHISANEWRYDGILKTPTELRAKLEDKLARDYGKDKRELANKLEIAA